MYNGEAIPMTEVPNAILENMMATEYGWTLEYIRALSPKDFNEQLAVMNIRKRLQANEYEKSG